MDRKRVIFHLGAHKTASTYLQSVFSQQAENLRALDVDYPYAESEEVINSGACVGNVVKMLYANKIIQTKIKSTSPAPFIKLWSPDCTRFLIDVIKASDCHTVLLSSEGMSKFPQAIFDDFYSKLNIFCDPEFIIFVRDPFDYYYSSWAQLAKAHYETKTFDQKIAKVIRQHNSQSEFKGLFFAFDIFSTAKHKIINYDSYKKDLAASFFSIIDIDINLKQSSPNKPKTVSQNRSLSPSEAGLQLLVNRQFQDNQFPAFFRNLLTDRSQCKPTVKSYYNKELDILILDNFEEQIKQVNAHITGDNLRTQCRDTKTTQLVIEVQDIKVLIHAFKQITVQKAITTSLLSQFKHWVKCISLKNVPLDFDPKAYLFLNKDVAAANANPYLHYSQNGYREGRPYRFF